MSSIRTGRRWLLVAGLLIGSVAPAQQPYPNERYPSEYDDLQVDTFRRAERVPTDGFFPTNRQIYLIIDRITDDMARRYDFDDEQLERARHLIRESVPRWIEANKAELKTITNQWMDAMLAGKPPSAEYVAGLATRIMPLLNEFQEIIEATSESMRSFMTEDQQILLDGELAAFRVGVGFAGQRIAAWSEGGFDPAVDWPGGPYHDDSERRNREVVHQAMSEARTEAMGPDAPVVPVKAVAASEPTVAPAQPQPAPRTVAATPGARAITDEWERYVEDFITRYRLDAQQSERARRHLRVAQQDRDAYLRRRGEELKRAEQALTQATGEDEKQAARAALERIRRPIARQLEKLKENLDKLPTREQRAAAARADANAAAQHKEDAAPEPR